MKKVIVVSKTHLDLGFTDYAKNIYDKYLNDYIPGAVALAQELNTPESKKFIWTTGSWIIKEALKNGTQQQRENLKNALISGNIVPHALPFTTHTELLDEDSLEYGLSIVDELDKLRGRKTVAAKMTDVPGHTKALVPLLSRHGIKLLHIGVNGASALCKVPPCFLWRCGDAEVVVVYSGAYGGALKSEFVDEILYFDHTLDNHGAPPAAKIESKLSEIRREYPDYTVTAGTMDDFADVIWEVREKLPVVTGELGDTWIHGAATDPYKTAAMRELLALKSKWLESGEISRDSEEYVNFCDSLLCVAEHTWGVDMKIFFADYENYLKKDFVRARAKDTVKIRHLFRNFPQNFLTAFGRMFGNYKSGSYSSIEKSWQEQRDYITSAVSALSPERRQEAQAALKRLMPEKPAQCGEAFDLKTSFKAGEWELTLNENGGIASLTCGGNEVMRKTDASILEYRSFGKKDYDFWLEHYSRDLKQNMGWAYADFGRPLLKYAEGKYPEGRFAYTLSRAGVISRDENKTVLCAELACDKKLCEELGAPRTVQVIYTLTANGLRFNLSWFGKDASRLTEALYLRLFPAKGDLKLKKINEWIDPYDVVSMGARKLHAVFGAKIENGGKAYFIANRHAPLFSLGEGKILEFDDKFEDFKKDGISFVLHNNVWGTNFKLWYEDNASFDFEITEI